jgi:Ca2+-binding RTX toxin-like protein
LRGDGGANVLWGHDGNDRLYGRGGNDNLQGMNGNDMLFGQSGTDSLFGGGDDDILLGGADGDVLDGGAGLDRAQYSDATAGVLADLQNSAANTGFAAGDTYVSIENLLGSLFSDNLRGDGGANVLWGHDGNDRLYGRGGNDNLQGMNGNDSLYSGDGDDSLYGGDGNDLLDGGAGGDTFEFRIDFGSDRIVGFDDDLDEVRLDDAIWGSDLSAAVLLSTYGSVVSGSSFLDFGGGNTITFVNFANLSELADDFVFI